MALGCPAALACLRAGGTGNDPGKTPLIATALQNPPAPNHLLLRISLPPTGGQSLFLSPQRGVTQCQPMAQGSPARKPSLRLAHATPGLRKAEPSPGGVPGGPLRAAREEMNPWAEHPAGLWVQWPRGRGCHPQPPGCAGPAPQLLLPLGAGGGLPTPLHHPKTPYALPRPSGDGKGLETPFPACRFLLDMMFPCAVPQALKEAVHIMRHPK